MRGSALFAPYTTQIGNPWRCLESGRIHAGCARHIRESDAMFCARGARNKGCYFWTLLYQKVLYRTQINPWVLKTMLRNQEIREDATDLPCKADLPTLFVRFETKIKFYASIVCILIMQSACQILERNCTSGPNNALALALIM
jgi:hypothetical protein